MDFIGFRCGVWTRATESGLLGPIAVTIVLIRILCFISGGWLGGGRRSNRKESSRFREPVFPTDFGIGDGRCLLRGLIAVIVIRCYGYFLTKGSASPAPFRDATVGIVRIVIALLCMPPATNAPTDLSCSALRISFTQLLGKPSTQGHPRPVPLR